MANFLVLGSMHPTGINRLIAFDNFVWARLPQTCNTNRSNRVILYGLDCPKLVTLTEPGNFVWVRLPQTCNTNRSNRVILGYSNLNVFLIN